MTKKKSDTAWERWVAEGLRGRALREPAPGVVRRAVALGSELAGGRATGRRSILELIFDSAAQPLPVGVRASSSNERRLLFQAGHDEPPRELDLRIRRRSAGSSELTGQLLPPIDGARVTVEAGRVRRSKTLGPAGEFLLADLPADATMARLEIAAKDGTAFVIQELPLRFPESPER